MDPTEFSTTGLGWEIGIGRLRAVFGPMLAGVLIGMGLFMVFAIPTLVAGVVAYYISSKKVF